MASVFTLMDVSLHQLRVFVNRIWAPEVLKSHQKKMHSYKYDGGDALQYDDN